MLNERKLKILYAIINSYITTSEPIGSRTISKQYDIGISSATVRNEMSDLEELGFLVKNYSSSGRIPSDKAYRHYVNYLLSLHLDDTAENVDYEYLDKSLNERDLFFLRSAKLLSEITDYITATMIIDYTDCILKNIDIIEIQKGLYVLVLIFDTGKIINNVFSFNTNLINFSFEKLISILRKELIGKNISEIKLHLDLINKLLIEEGFDVKVIIDIISNEISKFEDINIKLDGISNIFNFPEYNDIDKARKFVNFLENKDELHDLFLEFNDDELYVRIGSENNIDFLNENTVVATSYKLGMGSSGKIAIIGPTRMDYERIISTMISLNFTMNKIFK